MPVRFEEKAGVGVVERWREQSTVTDPGRWAQWVRSWGEPGQDVAGLVARVGEHTRQVIRHYRADPVQASGPELGQIDLRWVDRVLRAHHDHKGPVWGCCRDFAVVGVAALRQAGVPARSRVGFASYLAKDFFVDHVVVEYWNGTRWVWADTQLDPELWWPMDPLDIPTVGVVEKEFMVGACRVWLAHRAGQVDVGRFGVLPDVPMLGGGALVRDYVWLEVAHRMGTEVLLWDSWGAMGRDGDSELTDQVAALVVAADQGEPGAEEELAHRWARDERLHVQERVYCWSPSGYRGWVDVLSRVADPVV